MQKGPNCIKLCDKRLIIYMLKQRFNLLGKHNLVAKVVKQSKRLLKPMNSHVSYCTSNKGRSLCTVRCA